MNRGIGRSFIETNPAGALSTCGIIFTARAIVPIPPGISGVIAIFTLGVPSI